MLEPRLFKRTISPNPSLGNSLDNRRQRRWPSARDASLCASGLVANLLDSLFDRWRRPPPSFWKTLHPHFVALSADHPGPVRFQYRSGVRTPRSSTACPWQAGNTGVCADRCSILPRSCVDASLGTARAIADKCRPSFGARRFSRSGAPFA